MSEPTQAAMRAADALLTIVTWDDRQLITELIDEATGLPDLIRQRDALLSALRLGGWKRSMLLATPPRKTTAGRLP